MTQKINLALISPQKEAVSETFIRAHKLLPFNIKFYYGGYFPNCLEGQVNIYHFNLIEKILMKFSRVKEYTKLGIIKSFRKEKINCILAEYGPSGCEILEVARKLKIPLIVHFHGFDATNADVIAHYQSEYKKMFYYASNVVAVSEKMKKDLINLGCAEQKIIISPCGPNPRFLKIKPLFENIQFIAVARFVDVKGYLFTFFAYKKVIEKYRHAKLICIGDGPQLESCKQFVKIMKLENDIIFKGVATPEEIQIEMSKSYAFLQHSVTLSDGLNEGAPVSVLEAMSASLPVVCSNSGGIRDLVVNYETGFLVNEFDTDSMANYMIKLIENKSLAIKMGEAGRARVLNKLNLERHLNTIEKMIVKAVA